MIMDTTNFQVKRALFQNSDKEIASMKSEVKQNSNPKSVSIIHITEVANQENNHQHAKPTPMNIESNSESLSIESENEKENILTKEVTDNVKNIKNEEAKPRKSKIAPIKTQKIEKFATLGEKNDEFKMIETRPKADTVVKKASRILANFDEDNRYDEDVEVDTATQVSSADLTTGVSSRKTKVK